MKSMKLAILGAMIFAGSSALACSYRIDEAAKTRELKNVALAGIKEGQKIGQVTTSEFSYFESKPTPMCPEELTYKLKVEASTKTDLGNCKYILTVTKVEPWKAVQGLSDVYTVEGRTSAICTR